MAGAGYTISMVAVLDDENLLKDTISKHGIVIITNVVDDTFCEGCRQMNYDLITELSCCTKHHECMKKLGPQERPWYFKSYVTNCDWLWQVRCNDNVRKVFSTLHGTTDLVAGGDGFSYVPEGAPSTHRNKAHTVCGNKSDYVRYTGQLVLATCPEVALHVSTGIAGKIGRYIDGHSMQKFTVPEGALAIWNIDMYYANVVEVSPSSTHLAAFISYRGKHTMTERDFAARGNAYFGNRPTGLDLCSAISNGTTSNAPFERKSLIYDFNEGKVHPQQFYSRIRWPRNVLVVMKLIGQLD